MKKYFAIVLGLLVLLPVGAQALESTDLAVDLGEDMQVQVGEKFTITVKSAYDKTETCNQFFYDWRQSKGPITAAPLNNNVLAPEFQLNTAGTYVFSLAIETRCDNTRVRSETDKITVTVTKNENTEVKNYAQSILPAEVSLTADGIAQHDLNFFLEDGTTKLDNEKIEFSLSSDDEILKNNLGTLTALSDVTKKGIVALNYTAPKITDKNWAGGNVKIEGKSAYGSAKAQIVLKPQTTNYRSDLSLVQTVENLPYLAQNQKTLGLLGLEIFKENASEIGVVDIVLNGKNIYHEEKIFFKDWTDAQKSNSENLVSFYFTPTAEENVLTAQILIGGEKIALTKNFKAYDTNDLTLEFVALAEGKWAKETSVDLSENLQTQVDFLAERVPTDLILKNALNAVPVISADKIKSEYFVVLPEGYDGEILSAKSLHADGAQYELAQKYFGGFAQENTSTISDKGVLIKKNPSANINDKGFEIINPETPSVLSKNGGDGLPYELAWASLADLRAIGSFTDLQRSHWSYEYLRNLIGRGIIGGYADATVRPDQEITRAEFVKILLGAGRIEIREAQNNMNFKDMSNVDWSLPYVEKAVRYGLVSGYADGTFRPNKSITRAEAGKIIKVAVFGE